MPRLLSAISKQINLLAGTWVQKVAGKKLQISDRGNMGAQNFNYGYKFTQNVDFQSQISYFWNKIFWQGRKFQAG